MLDENLRALGEPWEPRPDLLESGPDDAVFVAEIDDDGMANLRYGDDDCGRAVEAGTAFAATYRIGIGRAGLVGPEVLAHVVYRRSFTNLITKVRIRSRRAGPWTPNPSPR